MKVQSLRFRQLHSNFRKDVYELLYQLGTYFTGSSDRLQICLINDNIGTIAKKIWMIL